MRRSAAERTVQWMDRGLRPGECVQSCGNARTQDVPRDRADVLPLSGTLVGEAPSRHCRGGSRLAARRTLHIDIVDVFRPAAEAAEIARQAAAVGTAALWLQLGIASDDARAVAEAAGLTYVEDTCIGETTARLGNKAAAA